MPHIGPGQTSHLEQPCSSLRLLVLSLSKWAHLAGTVGPQWGHAKPRKSSSKGYLFWIELSQQRGFASLLWKFGCLEQVVRECSAHRNGCLLLGWPLLCQSTPGVGHLHHLKHSYLEHSPSIHGGSNPSVAIYPPPVCPSHMLLKHAKEGTDTEFSHEILI